MLATLYYWLRDDYFKGICESVKKVDRFASIAFNQEGILWLGNFLT